MVTDGLGFVKNNSVFGRHASAIDVILSYAQCLSENRDAVLMVKQTDTSTSIQNYHFEC